MKNIFITIATLAVVLFSCTDFLEEDPYVNLVQGEGIQSVEEMQMFVAGMYGTLTSGNSHLQFETLALLMSLDGSVFHRNGNLGMSNLTLYASTNSAYIAKTYEWFYYSIGEANTLISKISATGFEESVKNLYLGDAYFFRALNYYYLVLIYGGVRKHLTLKYYQEALRLMYLIRLLRISKWQSNFFRHKEIPASLDMLPRQVPKRFWQKYMLLWQVKCSAMK